MRPYRFSRIERRQAVTALMIGLPVVVYLIDLLGKAGGAYAMLFGGALLVMSLAMVGAQVWWSAQVERRNGNANG